MIDWTKKIETTDGRPARLVATLVGCDGFRRIVVYGGSAQREWHTSCMDDGRSSAYDFPFIRNVVEEKTYYLNVYGDHVCTDGTVARQTGSLLWPDRARADKESLSGNREVVEVKLKRTMPA